MNVITVHITFGTYGTRLHGSTAPTVHHASNRYGEPFVQENAAQYEENRARMKESPCYLESDQCLFVEEEIPSLCQRGGWTYHLAASQEDHVHSVLSVAAEPETVRKWLKTWLTQSLNKRFHRRTWFAEGGSCKRILDDSYFQSAYQYILRQRTHQE